MLDEIQMDYCEKISCTLYMYTYLISTYIIYLYRHQSESLFEGKRKKLFNTEMMMNLINQRAFEILHAKIIITPVYFLSVTTKVSTGSFLLS